MLQFRGRPLESEIGFGWREGVHPEDLDNWTQAFQNASQARQSFRTHCRLKRYDGEYRWIEVYCAARIERGGAFAGFVGSGVDVTEQKAEKESRTARAANGLRNSLTAREAQVLSLVAAGKSTKEVAAQLGISYKTADSHRSKIMEKMNVHETASLVRNAIRLGLVAP